MRLRFVLGAVAVVIISTLSAATGSIDASPQDGTPGTTVRIGPVVLAGESSARTPSAGRSMACDAAFFTRQMNALFRALGSGDTAAVARLFPSNRTFSFHADTAGDVVSSGGGIRITSEHTPSEQLFAAVQRGDSRSIAAIFPAAGGWQFEVAPSLAGFFASGRPSQESVSASDRGGSLKRLVAPFKGMRIRWTAPLDHPSAPIDHVSPDGTVYVNEYSPGPVTWRATGGSLRRHGLRVIEGGGKIAFYCESGRFGRIVLSPSTATRPR